MSFDRSKKYVSPVENVEFSVHRCLASYPFLTSSKAAKQSLMSFRCVLNFKGTYRRALLDLLLLCTHFANGVFLNL